MFNPEFLKPFMDYVNMEPFNDSAGYMIPLHKRRLLPDAPQSAVDAFNEYKKDMAEAEKLGIRL